MRIGCIGHLAVEPFLFLGDNRGGSPNVVTNVAAKSFFQIRNDTVANAIAGWRKIFVRGIFAKF